MTLYGPASSWPEAARGYLLGPADFSGNFTIDYSLGGKLIRLLSSGTQTATIPTLASSGIAVGAWFDVLQYQPGSILAVSPASGVTVLNTFAPSVQPYAKYRLTHVATNVWTVNTELPGVPRSLKRWFSPLIGFPQTYWSFTPGIGLLSTGSGGSGTITIPLGPFDDDMYLQQISVVFMGAPGHSSLPSGANKPSLSLFVDPQGSSSSSAIATTADPSLFIGAYESVHSWSAIPVSPVGCAGPSFWATFKDEAGAGTASGRLISISATLLI